MYTRHPSPPLSFSVPTAASIPAVRRPRRPDPGRSRSRKRRSTSAISSGAQFGGEPPDYPRHLVALYKAARNAFVTLGYLHCSVVDDLCLCGGLVEDERAIGRMPGPHQAALRASGGVAARLFRGAFARSRGPARVLGQRRRCAHSRDHSSPRVSIPLAAPHLLVRWNAALTRRCAAGAASGAWLRSDRSDDARPRCTAARRARLACVHVGPDDRERKPRCIAIASKPCSQLSAATSTGVRRDCSKSARIATSPATLLAAGRGCECVAIRHLGTRAARRPHAGASARHRGQGDAGGGGLPRPALLDRLLRCGVRRRVRAPHAPSRGRAGGDAARDAARRFAHRLQRAVRARRAAFTRSPPIARRA